MIGVYEIRNISDNKRYIGSSVNTYKRLHHHKNRLRTGKHVNSYLQRAYDKHGLESFEFKEIVQCSKEDLEFYEQLIINGYNANERDFGYNLRTVSKSNAGMQTKRNTHKAGDKYNRLTLVEPRGMKDDKRYWLCQCDCGNTKEIIPGDVKSGHAKSCGCLNTERLKERITEYNKTHGPWNKKERIN